MDFELDNNKVNETDKTSQPLLLNANKQIKTDDDDETGGQINDDLNNKIELKTSNNAFADILKESGNHLNLFSHDDNNTMSANIGKSSFENNEDMGPETSVDTTDDADHDTNNLECSTLSHSKETTPSSDNPFDYKFSPQDSESEDIHNNKVEKISSFNESFPPFLQKPNEESIEEMNVPPSEDLFNIHSMPSRQTFDLLSDINQPFMNEPEIVLEPISKMITEVLKNEDEINESDEKLEGDVINEPKTPDLFEDETNDPQKDQTEKVHFQSVHETVSSSSTPKIDDTEVHAENPFSIVEVTAKILDTLHESDVHEIDTFEQDAHKSNGDIIKSDLFSGLVKENETSEDHEYYGEENIGNKSPENLNKSQEDIISMGFSVEKTSTYGDSELERESELKTEETVKKEIFSSLDCEQKADQDNKTEMEQTELDLKGDVGFLKTNELYATTPHESCDESADEWNYMKSKGENTKEDDSKKIGSEETANNQSQEPEELIKQEPEEKASDTSIKHSEDFEDKYSESLDKEVEDMSSQLNPEAKEFVPTTSPVPGELSASPPPVAVAVAVTLNGDVVVEESAPKGSVSMDDIPVLSDNEIANQSLDLDASSGPEELPPKSLLRNCLNTDEVVAQSPRKGAAISMENIQVPSETEFDSEIASRPSEIGVSTSDPYQELNLKEAMHGSEKEEQSSPDEQYGNSIFESADMRTSMYVENSLVKIEDEMNKIQQLPNDNDETQDLSFEETSRNETNVTDKNESNFSAATLNDHSNESVELNGTKPQDLTLDILSPTKQIDLLSPIKTEETITKTVLDNKLSKVSDSKKIDPKTKSVSGPKKVASSTSATLSDTAKPRTGLTASKTKVGVTTSQTTRPRTAPVSSSKPLSTEKKPSSNAISARTKIETKVASSTIGAKKVPITKPKLDESKTGARPLPSKVGLSTKPTSRTASTTSTATTKRAPISSSSLTTKTLGTRPTLSPNTKTAPITATSKPAISPRSTVASTLRKTEAVKSPTTGPRLTSVRTTTTTTTTTTGTRPTGSTLHKAPTSSTAPIARKLPATTTTASKMLTKKPVTKPTSTVKQSATTKVTTSSVKTETCEIKMNGSSNGEIKN